MRIALRSDTERMTSVPPIKSEHAASVKQEQGEEEQWYVCRHCRQKIVQPSDRITIQESFRHTFANPSGIVYEFFCFGAAPGCCLASPPSIEFTWFPGYSWRISICSACGVHLGWMFSTKDGKGFFGLIMDQLVLVSRPQA